MVDVPSGDSAWLAVVDRLILLVLAGFWVSFVVAQALGWRRSSGDRRQQLKWLMSGAAVLAASQAIFQPVLNFYPHLPVRSSWPSISYSRSARRRYRSAWRWPSCGTGCTTSTGSSRARCRTRSSPGYWSASTRAWYYWPPRHSVSGSVAVAATLAAAALFNPLRQRVQRAVDRRFNRARYDADKTVAAFAARVKDAVDLDSVRDDLAGAVHRALEPAHVSVWIRPRG